MESKMENKKRKRRILTTAISACLCLLLIGVSVWAAMQQSAIVTNTIKITAAEDVQCSLTISGQSAGTGIFDKETLPSSGYSNLLSLGKNDYTAVTKTGPNIVFCQQNPYGYYYYVYKFDFNNQSKVTNAMAKINTYASGTTTTYKFDSQVDVYFGSATDFDGSITAQPFGTDGYNYEVPIPFSTSGTSEITTYMVVAVNKSLFDVDEESLVNFDINVNIFSSND